MQCCFANVVTLQQMFSSFGVLYTEPKAYPYPEVLVIASSINTEAHGVQQGQQGQVHEKKRKQKRIGRTRRWLFTPRNQSKTPMMLRKTAQKELTRSLSCMAAMGTDHERLNSDESRKNEKTAYASWCCPKTFIDQTTYCTK